jgi:dTDP-4-dehydrorhamnose 3,5-epimerase
MIFTELPLAGAFTIDIEPRHDPRGTFARVFCRREFAARGLKDVIAQANISINASRGLVRGLHFQWPPHAETKLVRCVRGALLDVIVDLRPESATFLQHLSVELRGGTHRSLYIPERFAHGYQVLEDDTELEYHVGEFYTPEAEGGLRHDDPALGIRWPLPPVHVSAKDARWPLLSEGADLRRRMTVAAAGGPGGSR